MKPKSKQAEPDTELRVLTPTELESLKGGAQPGPAATTPPPSPSGPSRSD